MKTRHDESNAVDKVAVVRFQLSGSWNGGAHCRNDKISPVEELIRLSLARMIKKQQHFEPEHMFAPFCQDSSDSKERKWISSNNKPWQFLPITML